MSKSEREGRWLIVVNLIIGFGGLAIYFFTPYAFGLFASGMGFAMAVGSQAALHQRLFWNKRFGIDLWDDGK